MLGSDCIVIVCARLNGLRDSGSGWHVHTICSPLFETAVHVRRSSFTGQTYCSACSAVVDSCFSVMLHAWIGAVTRRDGLGSALSRAKVCAVCAIMRSVVVLVRVFVVIASFIAQRLCRVTPTQPLGGSLYILGPHSNFPEVH